MAPGALVTAQGLGVRYGRRVALEGCDLRVEPGRIVGLVGPNGSGKTSLLRVLAGLLRPAAGSVEVLGADPFRDAPRVMREARFAFAPPALFEALSAREHLEHLARLGRPGVARAALRAECEDALRRVGLLARADDRVAAYSFGMRQRLSLAQALCPLPRLCVLDEPNDGLDPLGVLELRELLRALRDEHGVGILLASHLVPEVEELVDGLLVLDEGRTLFSGAPEALLAGRSRVRIRAGRPERARERLASAGLAPIPGPDGTLELAAGSLTLARAVELLDGAELRGFHEHRPSLQEAILDALRAARATEERA